MEPEREITDGVSDEELADLARLADGTLPPERRAQVEARVAASPELTQIAGRQAAALEALRGTANIGAPARLRGDIERRRDAHRAKRRRPFGVIGRAPVVAAAAVLLALALVLPAAFTGGAERGRPCPPPRARAAAGSPPR